MMGRLFHFLILPVLVVSVSGAPLPVRPAFFRDAEFIKSFVGSYGFLSPVEPKVDAEEAEVLIELQDLFGNGQYAAVEKRLKLFMQERRQPTDPEIQPKEVSPAMIFVLGNLYFQNDRLEKAESAYELALKKFPKFRRAHKNLAMLHASKGDMERALPFLTKAIQLGDADHRSFGLLGYAYLLKRKPVAAEGAYRQAYLLNPEEKDWKQGLAQSLMLQEKWPASASLLGELIEESPGNAELWKKQANCYIEMDQKIRAAVNFEVLRLKGLADAATLDLLGNLYMDQEQPILALRAYLSAMKNSSALDVQRSLKTARILVDYGAPGEAIKYLAAVRDKADTLRKDDLVGFLLIEVDAARSGNDMERVSKLLGRILAIDAGNGEALVQQGMYLEEMARSHGDAEEAQRMLARARASFRMSLEKPEVAYEGNLRYGQMLVRKGDSIEALPYLRAALEKKKSDNLVQYIRRVERAAARQKVRQEREAADRAEAEARAKQGDGEGR